MQPVGDKVPDYLPEHFPPFPPAHTYKKTQSNKKLKKIGVGKSHLATSKSTQESLAVLEGLKKPERIDKSVEKSTQGFTVTDESQILENPASRILNSNSSTVRTLSREDKILLGLPITNDTA